MGPELALAIDACVTESSALLVSLVKKVNEVRNFKKKCRKLQNHAKILVQLLDKNRSAVKSLQSLQEFDACLKRINGFVDTVSEFNWIDSTWEVFWKHTYRSLTKQIASVKEIFVLESVVRDPIANVASSLLNRRRSKY
jgi:hypothetical protein